MQQRNADRLELPRAVAAEQELVSLKLAQNDLAGGRQLLETLLKRSPQNLSVLRRLADIDFENRKLDQVQRWEEAMNRCGTAGEALSLYFKIRRADGSIWTIYS